jgi:hypothetical protein
VSSNRFARDRRLVLHIGMHKTATTFLQNVLSARRYDLLQEGVLFPTAGSPDAALVTREGAQSGHRLFTRPGERQREQISELLSELPDSTSTVLVSSEDFTLPSVGADPGRILRAFSAFGRIEVVLVLRRQDQWIESYYKQQVDQYGNFETRAFDAYLEQTGPSLLDFRTRFEAWRELVGPDSFHVLSYDDLGGEAICRRVLQIAGVTGPLLETATEVTVPRYESVRAIDTLGLRILNSYRLADRSARIRAATSIYAVAPPGDLELVTPQMREAIQATYRPMNELLAADWIGAPAPAFCFGTDVSPGETMRITGSEIVEYVDRVIALCEAARAQATDGSGSR